MKTFQSMFLLLALIFAFSCTVDNSLEPNSNDGLTSIQNEWQTFDGLSKASLDDVVRVMTRNIYIGADVDVVLSAQNPNDIPVLAAQAFQEMLSTNFPERAIALAKEIAATKPDLIGLQEVTLLRYQSPGDAVYGGTEPAEEVLMDYLEIFMATLQAMGLDYKVAGKVENVDVEIPMITGVNPNTFDDIRVTDHDVILVRSDVEVSNVVEMNFQTNMIVPTLGLEIKRGFVAVNVEVGNQTFCFVNTHLEPFVLQVQLAQVAELDAYLANETLPLIIAGDFNTPAPTGDTYLFMEAQGYADTWMHNVLTDNPDGFTYGHQSDLRNETANFYERIDYIFTKGLTLDASIPVSAIVVGDEEFNKTASGLWPSDHGGVVARIKTQSEKLNRLTLEIK